MKLNFWKYFGNLGYFLSSRKCLPFDQMSIHHKKKFTSPTSLIVFYPQIFHQILTWTVKIKTLMEEETTRRRWDKSTSKRLGMAVLMWLVLYSSYILRTVLGTWQQIYAVTKVMMMREALLWNLKYYLLVVNHGFAMHNAQCTMHRQGREGEFYAI